MQTNRSRASNNKKENIAIEEQTVLLAGEQETETLVDGQMVHLEAESDHELIEGRQPETTWVWSRRKRAWVEVLAEHATAESPDDTGSTMMNYIDRLPQLGDLSTLVRRIGNPKAVWRLFPDRGTVTRVIDTLTSKGRILRHTVSKAAVHETAGMELIPVTTNIDSNGEADESNRILIQDPDIPAEKIIALAGDRAKEWADKIVAQAEQKAEERVESIITKAEETALAKAINIIISAEERAEALAEHIVSRAEELARVRARNIIAQTGELVQRQSKSLIVNAEEQAEEIIASTKEMQQHIIAATKNQAMRMSGVSDNDLKDIKADLVREIKSMPGKAELFTHEGEKGEQGIPCRGTAELVIESPVDYRVVRTLLKRIKVLQDIKVLDFGGSADKSVRIRLLSQNLGRLPFRISAIPEIEKVTAMPLKTGGIYPLPRILPGSRKKNGQPDRRFLISVVEDIS